MKKSNMLKYLFQDISVLEGGPVRGSSLGPGPSAVVNMLREL